MRRFASVLAFVLVVFLLLPESAEAFGHRRRALAAARCGGCASVCETTCSKTVVYERPVCYEPVMVCRSQIVCEPVFVDVGCWTPVSTCGWSSVSFSSSRSYSVGCSPRVRVSVGGRCY